MEYKFIYLPISATETTELLNEFAKQGWIVICSASNGGVILGREVKEEM